MTQSQKTTLAYLTLLLCAAGLIARGFFSFDWYDEPFYLQTVHRLYQGDALFVHEWHPTQFFAPLVLPLFTLYMRINGSADGIFLAFRIGYILFSLLVAGVLFHTLRRSGTLRALIFALIFLLYAKASIITFSYNTLGVSFFALALVCIYQYAGQEKKKEIIPFLSGVCSAISAVCIPHLGIVYLLGWVGLGVARIAGVKLNRAAWRAIWTSLAGVALVLAAYLTFVLATVPLNMLSSTLPNLFRDPDHPSENPISHLIALAVLIAYRYKSTILITGILTLYIIGKRLFKKQFHPTEKTILFFAGALVAAVDAFLTISLSGRMFAFLFGFSVWGLQLFLLTEIRNRRLFACFFLPGVAFALAYYFASNTGISAIAAGLLASACASVFFLADFLSEIRVKHQGKWMRSLFSALATLIVVALLVGLGYDRVGFVYHDSPLNELTERIEEGPAAGLYTSARRGAQYTSVYRAIAEYADGEGNLLILTIAPWAYLSSDMRCGSLTTWHYPPDDSRVERYYTLFPDRLPDVILALNPEIGQWVDGPITQTGELGGFLSAYVREQGFEESVVDCGMVYRK